MRNGIGCDRTMNKKADFTFAQLAMILILLVLLVWVFFWYTGLGEDMVAMIHDFFKWK